MTDNQPNVPADLDAETAVLGAMLLTAEARETAVPLLVPEDFYRPPHAAIYAAIVDLYRTGRPVDVVSVQARLAEDGTLDQVGGRRYLLHLVGETPSSSNVGRYCEVVADRALRRRLIGAGHDLAAAAYNLGNDPDDITAAATATIGNAGRIIQPRHHPNFVDWSATVDMTESWVVPGVLERGDRAIVVAPEGLGKSMWFRQLAFMLACGIHWFTLAHHRPHSVAIIDVENSPRQIVRQAARIRATADREAPGWDHDLLTVIPFRTLDLNRRADRMAVESYLAAIRPEVLVIGPLYKIFASDSARTYEENAARAQAVLDDWRARYDCALLIEHHAPKGSGGHRDLDPSGSSLWLRWPEYGISLEPDKDTGHVNLRHFRGQREVRDWPAAMMRGQLRDWPWVVVPGDQYGPDGGRF